MAPTPNPKVLYKSIPHGYPVPGQDLVYDTSATIDLENVPLNGGYLSKLVVVSPEPWLRERLRWVKAFDSTCIICDISRDPTKPSYSTPMRLGYA